MFTMPAEWMPHERCWMAWPCRYEVWGNNLAATKKGYAGVAQAIARFEPVSMIVPPGQLEDARNHLGQDITLVEMPIDDSWTRDSGPCFVSNGSDLKAVCFGFNAWGNKYTPYDLDAKMAAGIAEEANVPTIFSKLIAEGGGISVDGEGTLLTTQSCFPNPNRNPDWSRDEITAELKTMLGVEKVIWLPGDHLEIETDGHVDGIAMFSSPGQVIAEGTSDPNHPWGEAIQANVDALRGETDARGRPLAVTLIGDMQSIKLPPKVDERYCRSYVNFYIANGAIIAPAYGTVEDDEARDVLAGCFPDREIVLVPIHDIAIGGGGIHCITQQQPKIS